MSSDLGALPPIDPDTLAPFWTPVRVGRWDLPHRLAMAPMTRSRAQDDGTPGASAATYYAQRAGFAMQITEGTQPSEDGQGYLFTPGLHAPAHVTGWREVADAVQAGGGRLVVQLMHVGRMSHPDNTPHGRQPVAPSAVAPAVPMMTRAGLQSIPTPRALATAELADVATQFADAARHAVEAGADGVEIHAANGYLLHQFLADNTNMRDDGHADLPEGRIRLTVDVARAVADAVGADRTGIRISPGNGLGDTLEEHVDEVYPALIAALAPLGLAYLHIAYASPDDALLRRLRDAWPSSLVLNRGGAPLPVRADDIESGLADVVTVGGLALANPDLVERLRGGLPLNAPDKSTFYGGDDHGYTDYPVLGRESS